jgi:hypothetical protein
MASKEGDFSEPGPRMRQLQKMGPGVNAGATRPVLETTCFEGFSQGPV